MAVTGRHDDSKSAVNPARVVGRLARACSKRRHCFRVCRSCAACRSGDGHPVYLLPGFMADSQSTAMLRRWLDNLGYNAIPWGFGRNLGPRGMLMERLIVTVGDLAREHGQPVSLIGQSLGGVFAREIAKVIPEADPSGHHARLAVQADRYQRHRTGGDAPVRDGDRREGRRAQAADGRHFASGAGAVDGDLQPHRWHRQLEDLHRRRNAATPTTSRCTRAIAAWDSIRRSTT